MLSVEEIQTDWLTRHRGHRRWMIVETGEGFEVHYHDADNVAPTSTYPDKRRAAARLLQLLGIGPVRPQSWPERVQIGSIELANPE